MKFLFCHIGWMTDYHGATDEDYPLKGGKHNDDYIGHEACNFEPIDDFLYGYVQITDGKTINIGNLGAVAEDAFIENITVVWIAPAPDSSGLVVVGWYKDATVYRDYEAIPNPSQLHRKDNILYYNIKTSVQNSHLLPPSERTLVLGRGKGWPGQFPLWYALQPENKKFTDKVRNLINSKSHNPDPDFTFEDITDIDLLDATPEGRKTLVTHTSRERSSRLIRRKKESALSMYGCLKCEVCGFNFEEIYGDIGINFCEVHHIKPLSETDDSVITTIDDLAIVCSNCHRMIHRIRPVPNIDEFKSLLITKNINK